MLTVRPLPGAESLVVRPSIVNNPALLESLFRLPVDADIPPELFEVIAIILVHVAAVDSEVRQAAADKNWGTK